MSYGNEEFRPDERRGWNFKKEVPEHPELKGYFAYPSNDDEEVAGKLGGEKKSGYYSGGGVYSLNKQCKYFDEKDPYCRMGNSINNITGCCIYHRYKYNELLAGEKVNSDLFNFMVKKGVLKPDTKLTEWNNFE